MVRGIIRKVSKLIDRRLPVEDSVREKGVERARARGGELGARSITLSGCGPRQVAVGGRDHSHRGRVFGHYADDSYCNATRWGVSEAPSDSPT